MWIAIVVTAVCAVYLVLKTLSLSRRVKEQLCNPTLTKELEQKYLKAAGEREQKKQNEVKLENDFMNMFVNGRNFKKTGKVIRILKMFQ